VGPANVLIGSSAGALIFTGPLYETKGPCVGNYSQAGRMGSIQGTGACVPQDGNQTFAATEVQGGLQGLTMRYGVQFAGQCGATGRMGGMRKGN